MKSPFNFKIEYQNGEKYDIHDDDIWVESFRILSPSVDYEADDIEGVNGSTPLGSSFNTRNIRVVMQKEGIDLEDFDLWRDEIFNVFRPGEPLKISRDIQPNKIIVCYVSNEYDIDYSTCQDGEFTIEFIMFEPFIKSKLTTADIDTNGLRYGDGWSYGMGLLYDDESHEYTHNDTSFNIYNAGNVPIHPFQQDLKITIEGASKGYELRNETTGDVLKITDDVNGVIVMDGANITDRNSQALRKTNRKYISLAKKWNSFTQNQNAKVSFDFRFYYF